MDYKYFLQTRLEFIIFFHEKTTETFKNIKLLIEDGKEPYTLKSYSEDGEPPFLNEWQEADMGMDTVGSACVSMLSSSLHLYMQSWFGLIKGDPRVNNEFIGKKGWFNGYKEVIEKLNISLSDCPADLGIIEQVTLARNRAQHPENIVTMKTTCSDDDLKKYPIPFFVKESELMMATGENGDISWWCPPSIAPTKEKLHEAISHVELFVSWLEQESGMK